MFCSLTGSISRSNVLHINRGSSPRSEVLQREAPPTESPGNHIRHMTPLTHISPSPLCSLITDSSGHARECTAAQHVDNTAANSCVQFYLYSCFVWVGDGGEERTDRNRNWRMTTRKFFLFFSINNPLFGFAATGFGWYRSKLHSCDWRKRQIFVKERTWKFFR